MSDTNKSNLQSLNESTNRVEFRGGNSQNKAKPPSSANQTLSSLAADIKSKNK